MNIKLTLILLFCFVIQTSFYAQQADLLIPGEMIIQFEKEADFQKFVKNIPEDIRFKKNISTHLQLYLFSFNPVTVNASSLLTSLNQHPLIKAAAQNFQIQYRSTTPDDEFFDNQKSFTLIEANNAWDINTSAPEDMVVAVIEGSDIEHEDLRDNIWINSGEIPDDSIDNDLNGYIDDYYGVNVADSTDSHVVDDHGISVSGIIGAKGNNGIGVAGMLWDIKLMIVSSNLTFDQIIASYEYVYNMRKRYNDTNGQEGAFVVATNSSFGVNNADPDDPNGNPLFPVWCDMYDLMGSVGILSVAATNNNILDIEQAGDMPGLCTSDYLVVVTDTDMEDVLKAAFSRVHVDLSAPGRSYTTHQNDTYNQFNGTSAAAPLVTGALAMMFAYPCEVFQQQLILQPSQTALKLKSILLETVDPLAELFGKSVSGGRLNIFNAMLELQSQYGSAKGDLGFLNIYPNPAHDRVFVQYRTPEVSEYDLKVYDAVGRLVYFELVPEICSKSTIEIPVLNLASGIYFISIENKNNIKSSKFSVH